MQKHPIDSITKPSSDLTPRILTPPPLSKLTLPLSNRLFKCSLAHQKPQSHNYNNNNNNNKI